ncbi:hypothetical protein Hanom_Chr07g00677471 [Helianthus anomalus]
MATKCKPQGPRCNKFEIWTKVAKLAKPQGPKWQFTLIQTMKILAIWFIFLLEPVVMWWGIWTMMIQSKTVKNRVTKTRDTTPNHPK